LQGCPKPTGSRRSEIAFGLTATNNFGMHPLQLARQLALEIISNCGHVAAIESGKNKEVPGVATNKVMILPRNCTFAESDWRALSPFWYPVAFSHEVKDQPFAAKLLDERLVVFRTGNGEASVARDLCLHRGAPLSSGRLERGELVCKYHGFRYDASGQCVGIHVDHMNIGRCHSLRYQAADQRGGHVAAADKADFQIAMHNFSFQKLPFPL